MRVVAIDGPVGSGKSTVARAVAARLDLAHLDTGAMYRSVALAALQRGFDPESATTTDLAMVAALASIEVGERVLLDGVDVTDRLRTPEVGRAVSAVAARAEVRTELVQRQRDWVAERGGGVVEGRDIASVVFPDAAVKVYLTASDEERARRRSADEDPKALARRDRLDSTRTASPLAVAPGAVTVDSTGRSVDDVVEEIVGLWLAATGEPVSPKPPAAPEPAESTAAHLEPQRAEDSPPVEQTAPVAKPKAAEDVQRADEPPPAEQPAAVGKSEPGQQPAPGDQAPNGRASGGSAPPAPDEPPAGPGTAHAAPAASDRPDPAPARAPAPAGPPSAAAMALYKVCRTAVLAICKGYWRATYAGLENVPKTGAFVLAPVHRSFIDFGLVAMVTPRRVRFMGKDSLWKYPSLGRFLSALGAFPVRRGAADREALRRCLDVIAEGEPLVLFPEGTRQSGPVLADLFEGASYVAIRAGVPIVPVGVGGSERALKKGQRVPRPVKVHIVVGPPIEPPPPKPGGHPSRRAVKETTARLQAEVQRLFDQARATVDQRG